VVDVLIRVLLGALVLVVAGFLFLRHFVRKGEDARLYRIMKDDQDTFYDGIEGKQGVSLPPGVPQPGTQEFSMELLHDPEAFRRQSILEEAGK